MIVVRNRIIPKDATQEKQEGSKLYWQLYKHEKDMLPASRAFLKAVREHKQVELAESEQVVRREHAQTLLTKIKGLGRIPKELNTI